MAPRYACPPVRSTLYIRTNDDAGVVHQQALPVAPPARPSSRSGKTPTPTPRSPVPAPPAPRRTPTVSSSASRTDTLSSAAWSTASVLGGGGTHTHALCAFATGGARCICRAASLGPDASSSEDEGSPRRRSGSSATTLAPEPGGADPYHRKHCDTVGTQALGPAPVRRSTITASSRGGSRQGHARSGSRDSAPLSPRQIASPPLAPSPVIRQGPSPVVRQAPHPQAYDHAYTRSQQPTAGTSQAGSRNPTPTGHYARAPPAAPSTAATPTNSLGRSRGASASAATPTDSLGRSRGAAASANTTPTGSFGRSGPKHVRDGTLTSHTYTHDSSSAGNFDSLRTPTSLYDPTTPASSMRRPARIPGRAHPRPSLWAAAAAEPPPRAEQGHRVFNYYTTPTGEYRVPRATTPAPAPAPEEQEVSPTSADFAPEPIPAPAHAYPSAYGRGHGHGHGHSVDHTGREPSWISTSAWSARPGKGRRRAPSDPGSVRAPGGSPPAVAGTPRPPLSTAAGSSFSSYALVSPPAPSPATHMPPPILRAPAPAPRSSGGSSTAVGSGGGAPLSRTASKTGSFRRVRRGSLKAVQKLVSAVADAFAKAPPRASPTV
jgi:hypothetical protein